MKDRREVCARCAEAWRWWEAYETDWRAEQSTLRWDRPLRAKIMSGTALASMLRYSRDGI